MALDNMLDNGQAQAGAAGLARPAAVNPVKSLGQPRQVFGSNPRTRVLNTKLSPPIFQQRPSHPNRTRLGRVANCIGDQVRQGAGYFPLDASDVAGRA